LHNSERFFFGKRQTISSKNFTQNDKIVRNKHKRFIAQDSQRDGDKVMDLKLFRAAIKHRTRGAQNMKQILQNPTARVWFLSGLTGMVLIAGLLLEEGQARTYTPSPTIAPLQINKQNLQTHFSDRINPDKSQILESSREQKTKNPTAHEQMEDKQPAKKRMGLAILLLGFLAEEG
jgi:hypothetical protein